MQNSHLFEYAVIRVVPHVEREEFVNVGVILICSDRRFLNTRFEINDDKLTAMCPEIDLDDVRKHVASFELICGGGPQAGPIGKLPIKERFRWLTASRSTMLQTSPVHPGLCLDPASMLENLFKQLVL